MRLHKIGNLILPQHDGKDKFQQSPRASIVNLRNGGYDNDGNNLIFQPNRLSRNTTIIETEDIDDTLFDLGKQMAYGRQLLTAVLTDNTTLYHTWGKLTRYGRDANADKWGCEYPIAIEWLQDYPYWVNDTDDSSYSDMGLFSDDGEFSDDGYYNFILITPSNAAFSTTMTENNLGQVVVERIFFTIYPGQFGGYVTNPKILNEVTGDYIQYNGRLDFGDVLRIDCLSKTALINSTENAYGDITIGANQMEWFNIAIGSQTLRYSADLGNGQNYCIIQWARHYV